MLWCFACAPRPGGRYILQSVQISGNSAVDDDEIENVIASQEAPRFLGFIPGLFFDYEVFDRNILEQDLARIERYYQARGFYQARVSAGRVFYTKQGVRVEIVVDEGPAVLLRKLQIRGLEHLPEETQAAVQRAVGSHLRLGRAFEEAAFDAGRDALLRALRDNGYAHATTERHADVNLPDQWVRVVFSVKTGVKARLGKISLEGLGPLPERGVRDAFALKEGDEYVESDLDEAKQALLDLGVFSTVELEPQLDAPEARGDTPRVPIRVRVERAKLRSIHAGLGLQLDTQRSDVHANLGWSHSNFLGGFRRLRLEVAPGVLLFPTRLPDLNPPSRLLPEGRLRIDFRQPVIFGTRTGGLARGQLSVLPALLSSNQQEGAPLLGYRDARVTAGLERASIHWYGSVTHNLQLTSPFAYIGTLDPALDTVLVSYPELAGRLDLRDDQLQPHHGFYASASLQGAGVGGDAEDVKFATDVRGYVPLARRVTLAARVAVGLLLPFNYGATLVPNAFTGSSGGASRAEWIRDVQLLFLRAFFAGGAGSNRGYTQRRIGPHGVVPFFNPGQSDEVLEGVCDSASPDYSPSVCDLALGGLTLWEASLEVRYPLAGSLSGTVFADTADVAPERVQFRFDRPHLSVGAGLRYDTPIGPVRADLGYRVPGLQAPDSADEGTPETLLGFPAALSIGIGEAF